MKKNMMLLCVLAMGPIFCAQASMFERIAYSLGFGEKARREERQHTIEEFVREEFKKGTSVSELERKLSEKADNTSENKAIAAIDAQREVVCKDWEECIQGRKNGCSEFFKKLAQLDKERETARVNYCDTPEHEMKVRFWSVLANRSLIEDKERRIEDKKREVREYVERNQKEIKVLEAQQEEVEKELKEQFLGKN